MNGGWLDALLALMSQHGYPAVFIGGLLENVFIVGGFMPGETVVMFVAFVASQTRSLNPFVIWAVSVIGTMAGSNVSYAIGHRGGRPLLDAIGRRFPKLMSGIDKAEEYFEIHGTKTVFLSRFTAGFKNWVPTLAGVGHMKLPIFETYTLLSAMVYSTGLVIIGYFFGDNMDAIIAWFKRAGVWATAAVVVAAAVYVGQRIWRIRRIEHQVEEHIAEEQLAEGQVREHLEEECGAESCADLDAPRTGDGRARLQ